MEHPVFGVHCHVSVVLIDDHPNASEPKSVVVRVRLCGARESVSPKGHVLSRIVFAVNHEKTPAADGTKINHAMFLVIEACCALECVVKHVAKERIEINLVKKLELSLPSMR